MHSGEDARQGSAVPLPAECVCKPTQDDAQARRHQLVFLSQGDGDAVTYLIGHGKADIVQIIMQILDLLIQ